MNQYNDKGQRHGYWGLYWDDEHLMFKVNYINGLITGCCEHYNPDGTINEKEFHL